MALESIKTKLRLSLAVAAIALVAGSGETVRADLSEGLVSYWPMDVIQGTRTPDVISGYHMDLTNLTAEDLVEGYQGMAFSFDNERQTLLSRVHAEGEDLPANQHESWTVSIWVKVQGTGQNDLRIFSEGNTGDSNPLFNMGTHNGGASGQLDFYIRNGGPGWPTVGHIYTELAPFDGEWSHIVFVQEFGERLVYIDGELDSLEIGPQPEDGEWALNNTSIGGILRASASHWVTGLLDETAIWKRALTDDEIIELNESGVPAGGGEPDPLAVDLVSHWPLDAIQGTKTPDVVSGYDLDLTNLSAEDLVEGYKGMAFAFDNGRQTLLSRVHEADEDLPANQHDSWTLSIWANVEGTGQNDLRIFSEGSTEDSNPLFNLGTHNGGASGQLDFYIRNGGPGWPTVGHIYTELEPFDGQWSHIAFVENQGERLVYIDGELDGLEIGPRPEDGEWGLNNTSIGGILRASASHWVTGMLDEPAIWKRALSDEEVLEVMESGVPAVTGGSLPLAIRSFTAEYPAVVKGGEALLRWDASADATLSIDHGVGDVTAMSQFGVGSTKVKLDATKTFMLTAKRGTQMVTASLKVSALDGVADGWRLIDNFDTWEPGSINGMGSWKNPVGSATIVEGPMSQALTFQAGEALNAIELKSYTVNEGEKVTLFFRAFVDPKADAEGLSLNIGLSEKPIRFVGDFDNDVGPFVRFDNSQGFGVDVQATDGVGGSPEWVGATFEPDKTYNVWLDIDNRSVEDGDLFNIHVQEIGEDRMTVVEEYLSDRNPAGSTDLGAVAEELTTIFTVAFSGSESDGLVQFDDFYLSRPGQFLTSVPIGVVATEFLPEEPSGPIGGTGEIDFAYSAADGTVTVTFDGTLYRSMNVAGPYEPVAGAVSPLSMKLEELPGTAAFFIARP